MANGGTREWGGRKLPAEGTATARLHEKREGAYHEQDHRDAMAIREQDRKFQGALRAAFERGEFPGQSAPVLVLTGDPDTRVDRRRKTPVWASRG
jgi:hypothetical protein